MLGLITGTYTDSAQRCCNTNVEINHKISIAFQNLGHYNPHLIMQELGKCDFKTNVISWIRKIYEL